MSSKCGNVYRHVALTGEWKSRPSKEVEERGSREGWVLGKRDDLPVHNQGPLRGASLNLLIKERFGRCSKEDIS